jgi:hypothetical protein
MKFRKGWALSAAAVVCSCFAAGAFATGNPQPNTTQTYSAPTVALASGGNTAALPPGNPTYSTIAPTTVKAGDTIVWVAPTGNNWVFNGAPTCATNNAALNGALTGNGTSTLTCTLAGAGVASFVQAANAGGVFAVALQGAAVAQLANVSTVTDPRPLVQITAQNTGAAGGGTVPDASPIANVALTSSPLFFLSASGEFPLPIDLTGNGLPAIPPGAGFNVTAATVQPVTTTPPPAVGVPTQAVSTAGFLGSLNIFVSLSTDARNGLGLNANNPLFTNGSLTAAVTTTLFGDFATITSAYLLPNNSVPAGNQATCAVAPPANSIAGVINAARTIAFTGLGNPGNPAFSNNVRFSVCLVTNGTQVIQQSIGGPGGSFGVGIIASAQVTGIATPIPLTQPNQTFATIAYQGSVFFAQNVFGAANLYPVFFRAVNQGNTAAQIWAVLTKDVSNVVPEVGAGSCNDSAAILAAVPQPAPTGTPAGTACNISFVANLTATSDPTGLSRGLLQPNTGAYYLADAIATQAGTSLPAGNNKATVYLLSPNAGLVFSALSQLTTPGAPPIITSLP